MKIKEEKFIRIITYITIFFVGTIVANFGFSIKFKYQKIISKEKNFYTVRTGDDSIGISKVKKQEINYNDMTILVNKNQKILDEYIPTDLRKVNIDFSFKGEDEQKLMREEAAVNLENMVKEAKNRGMKFIGVSAYRSYETQATFYNSSVEKQGINHADKFSAKAGASEHQTGLSIDVSCKTINNKLIEAFDKTKEYIWLKENAHKYGFIIRYPKGKENITGYSYEPWHIRYVGKALAKDIKEKKLCLEEAKDYLQFDKIRHISE